MRKPEFYFPWSDFLGWSGRFCGTVNLGYERTGVLLNEVLNLVYSVNEVICKLGGWSVADKNE